MLRWGSDTYIFRHFSKGRQLLLLSVCIPKLQPHLETRSTLKERICPRGAKFFLFKIDIYWDGRQNILTKVVFPRSVCFPLEKKTLEYRNYDFKYGVSSPPRLISITLNKNLCVYSTYRLDVLAQRRYDQYSVTLHNVWSAIFSLTFVFFKKGKQKVKVRIIIYISLDITILLLKKG